MAESNSYQLPPPTSPYILEQEVISHGRYQGLATATYIDPRDPTKTHRSRDFVFLIGRPQDEPVGTMMPNVYKNETGQWCTVLVQQFRPQYQRDTIEFPAGFISRTKKEKAEEAAIRETEEETTKTGIVRAISTPLTGEPVQIAAQIRGVLLEVKDKAGDQAGQQNLDKGEFIEEWVIPLSSLEERLKRFGEERVLVDPRVWAFAMGFSCGRDIPL